MNLNFNQFYSYKNVNKTIQPDVKFEVMELDLSSLKSVKRFADKIKSRNMYVYRLVLFFFNFFINNMELIKLKFLFSDQ